MNTITVDSKESLYAALDAANANGGDYTIKFDAAMSGTAISIDSTLIITNRNLNLTIDGDIDGNGTADITFDGGKDTQIMRVVSGGESNIAINGITFTNGNYQYAHSSGALHISSSTVTITDCRFIDNVANAHGGAIFVEGTTAAVTIENSVFSGNKTGIENSSSSGGAININTGEVTVIDSVFTDNESLYGGAIYTFMGTLNASGTEFTGNHSFNNGGALNGTFGTMNVDDCEFNSNRSETHGGAIDNAFGTLTVSNSEFTKNHAVIGGGAIDNVLGGDLILLDGNVMNGNTADTFGGGGVRIFTGDHPDKPAGRESLVSGTLTNGGDVWIGEKITIEGHLNVVFDVTKPEIGNSYLYHNLNGFYFEGNPIPDYQVIINSDQKPWVFNLANNSDALKIASNNFRVALYDENGPVKENGEQVYISLSQSYTKKDAKGIALTRYELYMNGNGILMLSITDARPKNLPVKWYYVNSPDDEFKETVVAGIDDPDAEFNHPDPIIIGSKNGAAGSFYLMTVMEATDSSGVSRKGIAWNTRIENGGEQRVFNGGTVYNTEITGEGSIQYVFVGGTSVDTRVEAGGTQHVSIASKVFSTKLRGGTVILEETATIESIVLAGGLLRTRNMMDDGAKPANIKEITFDAANTAATRFENVSGVELNIDSRRLKIADNSLYNDDDALYRTVAILITDKGDFEITNNGVMDLKGSIETVAGSAGAISIINTGSFNIRSTGNTADGKYASIINASSNGIDIVNSGTFKLDSIRNVGDGGIDLHNTGSMIFDGRMITLEGNAAKIAIHNSGVGEANTLIDNSSSLTVNGSIYSEAGSTGNIRIVNTGVMTVSSSWNDNGTIRYFTSIANNGDGDVSIDNSGNLTVDSVRNERSGLLEILNRHYGSMTFNGRLISTDGEAVTFTSAIHSTGAGGTTITNQAYARLIVNGAIFAEEGASGNITINNSGEMTVRSLDSSGNIHTSIFNKGSGNIAVNNWSNFTADGIRNESSGSIAITHYNGKFTLNSRNVNNQRLSVWSNGSGSGEAYNISIDNRSVMTFDGAVRSEISSTGNIIINNTGTMSILDKITGDREITHDTTQAAVSNYGNGYLSITNGASGTGGGAFISGAIDSFGQGQLFFANSLNSHAYVGSTGIAHLGDSGWKPTNAGFLMTEWLTQIVPSLSYMSGQNYSIGVIGKDGYHLPGFGASVFILNNGRMTLDAMIFSISDSDLVVQNGAGTKATAGVISIGSGKAGEVAVINLYSGDIILGGLDLTLSGGSGTSYGQYIIKGDIINVAGGDIYLGGIKTDIDGNVITASEYNLFNIQGNILNESFGHIYIGLADNSVIGALNAGYEIRNLVSSENNSIFIDMKGSTAAGVKIYSNIIGQHIAITGNGTLYGKITGGEVDPADPAADVVISVTGQAGKPISVNNTISGVSETNIAGSTSIEVRYADVSGNIYGGGLGFSVGGDVSIAVADSSVTGNVYGGGDKGDVNGNIVVNMGGTLSGNLSGGSNKGSVGGSITLDFTGEMVSAGGIISGAGNSLAVGSAGNTGKAVSVNINTDAFSTYYNVFAGNYVDAAGSVGNTVINGNVELNILANGLGSADVNGTLYGGSARNKVNGSSTITGKSIMNFGAVVLGGLVYGGSYASGNAGQSISVATEGGVEMNLSGTMNGYAIYGGGRARGGAGTYAQIGTSQNLAGVSIKVTGGSKVGLLFGGASSEGSAGVLSVVYGDISIAVDSGVTFSDVIYGGGRSLAGNSICYGKASISISGQDVKVEYVYAGGIAQLAGKDTITLGTELILNDVNMSGMSVYGGGRATETGVSIVGANSNGSAVTGSIGSNIVFNGGTIGTIYGGGNAAGTATAAVYGGSHITVTAGTIVSIFGGGYCQGTNYNAKVYGGSNILIDASGDTSITISTGVYGGGLGNGTVAGGSNIVFTGNGANLNMSGAYVSGDSGKAGSVSGVRSLTFDQFSGSIDATFVLLDSISIVNGSSVVWTAAQNNLSGVSNWNFDLQNGQTTLNWETGNNSFTGDVFNLNFDEGTFSLNDFATVLDGGASSVIAGWQQLASVSFNGIAGSFVNGVWVDVTNQWQLSANASNDLIVSKIA